MSKVRGIERFADAMSGCKGGYVLIGGGACSVLFDNEGDSFRATEDLDVVVIVDGKGVEFATALWAFIKAAGYETGKVGDGYYEFIRDNATNVEGITLLDALHIIPLKMRAHIDINRSYEEGRHCNDKDRRKHRSDIVRLAGLLPPSARLELIEQMRADAGDFFADFSSYVNRQTDRKERARLQDTLSFLEKVYL